jgi:hypothetical protein
VPILERTAAAVSVYVVRYGRPTELDCLPQNFIHGSQKSGGFRPADTTCRGSNPCAKQRFIGVDIPDAAEDGLIEQHGFNVSFAPELFGRDFGEGVRT